MKCVGLSRPKMVILENVKSFTNKKHKVVFDQLINDLKDLGYRVDWKILNSKDYGTPQQRSRVFIIGRLDDTPIRWPQPVSLEESLTDIINLDEPMTLYTSTAKYGAIMSPLYIRDSEFVISNGQTSGKFSRFYKWPLEFSYCLLTALFPILYRNVGDQIYTRPYTNREMIRLMGFSDGDFDNVDWSPSRFAHILGNGIG